MKKFNLLLILLAVLTVFNGCQKDETVNITVNDEIDISSINLSVSQRDVIIENLASVLASAINEKNIRTFLHNEIAKQFTNDYDILYPLIKNKMVEVNGNELVSFEDYLIRTASDNNIDISLLVNFTPFFKNLQISSPVYFDNWDFETYKPVVISLPVNYSTTDKLQVNGYLSDGSTIKILEDDIKEPILLVRQAERVDDNGLMRVDYNGFVIPKEYRLITAEEAYLESKNVTILKSANRTNSIIEVIDDNQMDRDILSYSNENSYKNDHGFNIEIVRQMFNELNNNTLLKSAQNSLPIPKVKSVFPDEPYSIRFGWEGVPGATQYEIWRQYSSNPVEKIATLSNVNFTYLDINRISGQSYYFAIRALDSNGNVSPMSEPFEAIASWRKKGSRDLIEKVFISDACWNWCCGLFDGKIELQYKVAYYDHIIKTAAAFPSGSSNLNNLGQKTKNQQKGKWCDYNTDLFPWSIEHQSYDYRMNLIEDDGNGTGTKITIEGSFKIPIKKIEASASVKVEFNIANNDENLGEILVSYWDPKSKIYSFSPKNGSAQMILKQ
jgi:hypothetical protein